VDQAALRIADLLTDVGRLVLLLTSPRVAPGLLTGQAWRLLRGADLVCCASTSAPLPAAVAAAGVDVVERPPALDALLGAGSAQTVVWLTEPGDTDLPEQLGLDFARRTEAVGVGGNRWELEVATGSYDLPGARVLDLVAVMDRLRTACPWDREQTHLTLVHYLIEETYETVEAIEAGDNDDLREELGDLLLQIAFHARIGEEDPEQPWDIDDVAAGIVDKLVRRHPHVFADVVVSGPGDVETNWHTLKTAEKARTSALDGVPLAMPALTLADKLLSRSARAGHPAVVGPGPTVTDTEQLGDLLLQTVVAARAAGLDAEQSLRSALRRFAGDVRARELG
jgi:XTP/dITP diphosphohydrolase